MNTKTTEPRLIIETETNLGVRLSYRDVPEAYRVYRDQRASMGIIVQSLRNGEWDIERRDLRPLVRALADEIDSKEEE